MGIHGNQQNSAGHRPRIWFQSALKNKILRQKRGNFRPIWCPIPAQTPDIHHLRWSKFFPRNPENLHHGPRAAASPTSKHRNMQRTSPCKPRNTPHLESYPQGIIPARASVIRISAFWPSLSHPVPCRVPWDPMGRSTHSRPINSQGRQTVQQSTAPCIMPPGAQLCPRPSHHLDPPPLLLDRKPTKETA